MGYILVCPFLKKPALVTFTATIGNVGSLLIPTSDHTVGSYLPRVPFLKLKSKGRKVVVAPLVELQLPTPEIKDSNPVTDNFI